MEDENEIAEINEFKNLLQNHQTWQKASLGEVDVFQVLFFKGSFSKYVDNVMV